MDAAWEQAVRCGDAQAVHAFLAQGTDIDSRDRYGQTALMLAAHAGHEEIAILLAQSGADLSLRGSGAPGFADKAAYDLALERDMPKLVKVLAPKPEGR